MVDRGRQSISDIRAVAATAAQRMAFMVALLGCSPMWTVQTRLPAGPADRDRDPAPAGGSPGLAGTPAIAPRRTRTAGRRTHRCRRPPAPASARPGTRWPVAALLVTAVGTAGAVALLVAGADGADIVTAIRSAAAGQAVFGAALAGRLSRAGSRPGRPRRRSSSFPQLTERERSDPGRWRPVLTNAQIGQRLYLSAKTVANNVSTILTKLQVGERGQAIVLAREAGLGRTD